MRLTTAIVTLALAAPAFARAWPDQRPFTHFDPKDKTNSGLRAAVAAWHSDQDQGQRDKAVGICRKLIQPFADKSDDQLRAMINELGGRDPVNPEMRDLCFQHALLYHLTGDKAHAQSAHVLLTRFAKVIPDWKIYRTHYGAEKYKHIYDQDWPNYGKVWDVAGIWGGWWYSDVLSGIPLAEAYDLIHDSNLMQDAGTLDAIEHMIRIQPLLIKNAPRNYGNMDGSTIRGILIFAELLREPQWMHDCVWWISAIYKTQFYADGWWHEGTPSYHKQIHHNLTWIMREWINGYSDPPGFKANDGTRYDKLDMFKLLAGPIGRADHALATAIQPNGIAQVIHDTTFKQPAWWTEPMKEAKSYLYGSVGHLILGTGEGENMVQASLHFGGTHGHAHLDCLNMIYFAKGKEIISETRYRNTDVPNSTREWHTSTAGHITVVVDEQSQGNRPTPHRKSRIPVRIKQPEDAVPGIPDGQWRWSGHGNAMNNGRLRLYNTDFDMVQVARADGVRAYAPAMEQYRRTIALVKISDTDTYVVDIFRVKGGRTHDYMLHGCLDFPHTAATSIDLTESRSGTLYKYISKLSSAKTGDNWSVTFPLDDGSATLKTFFAAQRGTEIIRGEAPAMRREGVAPFFAVRQSDGESVFVTVHHPFTDQPLVQDVKLLGPTRNAVKLRVTLADRVDTITSTSNGFTHEAKDHWRYEVGGAHTLAGTLTRTHRIEAGDTFDAFVTHTKLPTDGSIDGHTLMVDIGGQLVQSFRIDRIERVGNESIIHTLDEPGMAITPGLTKLEYFPCWGVKGAARFRIAASEVTRP